jgi:hypothetical protein
MINSQTTGQSEDPSQERESMTVVFSPSSAPLRSRWRNNGLSADFLGDYVTTFMPAREGLAGMESRQREIKHAVTYIANELLENAMKYHARDVDIPIKIHLELTSDQIIVSVSNGIGVGQAQRYKAFVEQLQKEDADDLLIKQQEESAKSDESTVSCLGLLTIMADYGARLDWRFEIQTAQSESGLVTTSALLLLDDIKGASA